MEQFHYQYLIQPVELEEYSQLKHDEKSILEEMLKEFDEKDVEQARKVDATFKYNAGRKSIGIYVGQNQLVLDDNDAINTMERTVIDLLHPLLERKLDRLRIYSEKWVDYPESALSIHNKGTAPPDDEVPF